jgi:hypothetical protein
MAKKPADAHQKAAEEDIKARKKFYKMMRALTATPRGRNRSFDRR